MLPSLLLEGSRQLILYGRIDPLPYPVLYYLVALASYGHLRLRFSLISLGEITVEAVIPFASCVVAVAGARGGRPGGREGLLRHSF